MKRKYSNTGKLESVSYFEGIEVEKTPAFGEPTLFVVGLQSKEEVLNKLHKGNRKKHIFFGANHSYDPQDADEFIAWGKLILHFLDLGYLCSLDIPVNAIEDFLEDGLCEYNNFIPQIRVPLPYIKLLNYNAMIKLDDSGFNKTNPGVWCHSLHDLMDRDKFTNWDQYKQDTAL